MSHPMVTFADAVGAIRTLPSLAPRPCSTNIRALGIELIDKLTIIPSEQTADLGYSGLAEQDAVYALQTNVAWANFINPGQVPPTDDAWTSKQSRTARNLHTAQKLCYDSESNVRRAINAALNAAIGRRELHIAWPFLSTLGIPFAHSE